MNRHDAWDLRCGFLENELSRTRYGYAMTPWPTLGGLDLAGLFMDRKKFISTGVYFSELGIAAYYFLLGRTADGTQSSHVGVCVLTLRVLLFSPFCRSVHGSQKVRVPRLSGRLLY
jgi:hypothetical protein